MIFCQLALIDASALGPLMLNFAPILPIPVLPFMIKAVISASCVVFFARAFLLNSHSYAVPAKKSIFYKTHPITAKFVAIYLIKCHQK